MFRSAAQNVLRSARVCTRRVTIAPTIVMSVSTMTETPTVQVNMVHISSCRLA